MRAQNNLIDILDRCRGSLSNVYHSKDRLELDKLSDFSKAIGRLPDFPYGADEIIETGKYLINEVAEDNLERGLPSLIPMSEIIGLIIRAKSVKGLPEQTYELLYGKTGFMVLDDVKKQIRKGINGKKEISEYISKAQEELDKINDGLYTLINARDGEKDQKQRKIISKILDAHAISLKGIQKNLKSILSYLRI